MSRFTRGNSRAAKLTDAQVLDIREKYFRHGYSQNRLAREYQVVPQTIGRIVNGLSRQNLTAHPADIASKAAASEERMKVLLNTLNETAEGLPIAGEIRAEQQLDSLVSPKARTYGAE